MTTEITATLLYEYKLEITSAVEFGVSMEDITSGVCDMPAAGIRQDAYFKGVISGEHIVGTVSGVDYIHIRADGRFELNIFATITTKSGENISLQAQGVTTSTDEAHILNIRQSIQLISDHAQYRWLNALQIWGEGTVDMQAGIVRLRAYT